MKDLIQKTVQFVPFGKHIVRQRYEKIRKIIFVLYKSILNVCVFFLPWFQE